MVVKSSPAVSFATATSAAGPFTFRRAVFPNGHWAGDLTVFQDPERPAEAYLIYSVRPGGPDGTKRTLVVAKLAPDWLDVEREPVLDLGVAREAPAAFHVPGAGYFIWTSHVTGWAPNAAAVYYAESMTSPSWVPLGNPTGNATSFRSQSTFVLGPVNGSYVYVADRFEPYVGRKVSPRYVWLPITNVSRTGLTVAWHDQWHL